MRKELLNDNNIPGSSRPLLHYYLNMAICHKNLMNYTEAIEFYKNAQIELENCAENSLKVVRHPGQPKDTSGFYDPIAHCYLKICYYEESLEYAREGKQRSTKPRDLISNLFNIAKGYFGLRQYGPAFVKFKEVIYQCQKIQNLDRVLKYLISKAYLGMAKCQYMKRNYKEALLFLKECLKHSSTSDDEEFKIQMKYKVKSFEAVCLRKLNKSGEAFELAHKTILEMQIDTQFGHHRPQPLEMYSLLLNNVLCGVNEENTEAYLHMVLSLVDPENPPIVPYRYLLHDEDVHTFLNIVKVTKLPFVNVEQSHGYARYRSSTHICQFFLEKRYI